MTVTLYCYSGNDQILSIDPNSLAIITLLHWYEVGFEIVQCCTKNDSPTKELPTLIVDDTVYSGYRSILKGLRNLIPHEGQVNTTTLSNREFLLQMNQDLLLEEFNNAAIFKNFTEPALLMTKSNYWWNFIRSRVSPLNYQLQETESTNLSHISKKSQILDALQEISKDPSIENRIILFSHLIIRSLLPKQYKFNGFDEFINILSSEIDRKEFKGKLLMKSTAKPKYKHESVEEYDTIIPNDNRNNMNVYTGLFGVVLAIAILYSIKNR